jgi:hypothetical protein
MISSFISAGPDAAQRAALRGASSVQPQPTSATPARRVVARTLRRWAATLDPGAVRSPAQRPGSAPAVYRRAA